MDPHAQPSRATRLPADDFESWWFADRRIWWRDFDVFGHLTAGSYGIVFQDVFGDLMTDIWGEPDADYVGARMDIDFLHEVRPTDNPVRVYVRIARVGRSGFEADLVLCAVGGQRCSVARAAFAAWDREGRCARPMTDREREALAAINGGSNRTGSQDR